MKHNNSIDTYGLYDLSISKSHDNTRQIQNMHNHSDSIIENQLNRSLDNPDSKSRQNSTDKLPKIQTRIIKIQRKEEKPVVDPFSSSLDSKSANLLGNDHQKLNSDQLIVIEDLEKQNQLI